MSPSLVFSFSLVSISAVLVWSHIRDWQRTVAISSDPWELRFCKRKLCRRTLASGLIGVLGVALTASSRVVDPTRQSFWFYWGGLFLALLGIGVLIVIDVIMIQVRVRRLLRAGLAEKASIESEIQQMRQRARRKDIV